MCNPPELYCLIQRDNGEVAPLISQEILEVIMFIIMFILSSTMILIFTYDITIKLAKIFWDLFTPGQQWIEILMIIVGIEILFLIKLVTDEVTRNLIKKFENMKEQNAEYTKKIVELEQENTRLNKKIGKSFINIVVE